MSKKRVLVVEDDPAMLAMLSGWLTEEGYIVAMASRGDDASRALAAEAFDALVIDLILPGGDGIEVIRKMGGKRPGLKVIAISGGGPHMPMGTALKTAAMLGADVVLKKPFGREELLAVLGGGR